MDILDRITLLLNGREQKELTSHLKLKESAFSEWKSGKSKSYRKYLIEISEFFNVSIDYLVYGKEKNLSSELPKDKQNLINLINDLDEFERGKVIGYIERIIDERKESAEGKGA